MKTSIDVETRAEGDRIKAALSEPTTRAFVNVMGALLPLDEVRRRRVLRFVTDSLPLDGGLQTREGGEQ